MCTLCNRLLICVALCGSTVKMSELYDVKEASVIDEEMLQKAIAEQRPRGQSGLVDKEEGLRYDKVTELRLDYRCKSHVFTLSVLLYVLLCISLVA